MESFMDAPVGSFAGGAGRAVSCFAPHGEVSIATGGVGGNRDLAFIAPAAWLGEERKKI
jgi:hypothetical protein